MASTVLHPTPKSTIDKEKKQAFVEFANGLKCPLIAFGTWKVCVRIFTSVTH